MPVKTDDKLKEDWNDKFNGILFGIGVLAGLCKLHGLCIFCIIWIVGYYICYELKQIRKEIKK